tara:strand:- start:65061 stop:65687 length:627 start_codon:yes stop_codon:yes gene_type:complete
MTKKQSIPLSIGLTGGIGSGKTAVSNAFEKLGVKVIDADILSRELVTAGSPALKAITEHFGTSILLDSGELNRQQLREIIFSDAEKKHWLEQFLHPRVRALIQKQLNDCKDNYALVVVPLLFETDHYEFLDRVLVVDSPEELQIQRVIKRDKTRQEDVKAIMAAQLSRSQRLSLADDIITNDGSLQALQEKVKALHEKYQRLSKQQNH